MLSRNTFGRVERLGRRDVPVVCQSCGGPFVGWECRVWPMTREGASGPYHLRCEPKPEVIHAKD